MVPTTKNPLAMLPDNVRLGAYFLLSIASIVFFAWQAADGDLAETIAGVLGALGFATAASNVNGAGRRRRDEVGAWEPWVSVLVMFAVAIVVLALYVTFFEGRR